jgi:hypothetical protein
MSGQRFMRIYEFEGELKSHRLLDLSLNMTALYEITRKRTPPEVVAHFIAKAASGETVTASEIKEASAEVIPFPKEPPLPPSPDFPAVVFMPEVIHRDIPLSVVACSPSTNWTLLHRLENVASYSLGTIDTPDLDGAVKKLIESGRLEAVEQAAEASSALAKAAIAAAAVRRPPRKPAAKRGRRQ